MNQKQALTQARKRWGKNAYVEDNGRSSSPEQRSAASDGVPPGKRTWEAYYYQYQVGYLSHVVFTAFHVCGSGDTWTEAFAEADRKTELMGKI